MYTLLLKKKLVSKKLLTLRDYLKETTFVFDPEDGNRLISKANPKLSLRIRKIDMDSIYVGFNFAHNFGSIEVGRIRSSVLEIEGVRYTDSTHQIRINKGEGAKWGDFAQKLIETVFKIYEEKYPVE